MRHIFLPTALLMLLLCLTQSSAAQRIFGHEDREIAWREASVMSLKQLLFSFVGKDLASLGEIMFSAMCFTCVYWPRSGTFASGADVFAMAFGLLYANWGLNHIWAILFPPNSSMIL